MRGQIAHFGFRLEKKTLMVLVMLFVCVPFVNAQFYQGYQTTFGKNRVQYQEFLWTFYRFKNFDTYFYVGGKEKRFDRNTKENDMKKELEKYVEFLTKNYQGTIFMDINEHGKHGAAHWQLAFPAFFDYWSLQMNSK